MYVHTYVCMYICICIYVHKYIQVHPVDLKQCADLKKSADLNWKEFANLKKYTNMKKCAGTKEGPQTYGPKGGEKWSWRSQWSHWCPNTYLNINTNQLIYRPVDWSRSISTVDSITPTEEYGRYRRSFRLNLRKITVDRGLSVNNRDNLWSILSTIPVDLEFNLKMITNYDFDGKKLQHLE